ncbi:CDP-diacylglycerol-serine O-phosphatidyltransferase [Candidatus Phytoplasma luffae]|uniref:CDP-diacylglycerol-serine O-phosphatidyltransferase n=1 Tax=Loofah witches'-broom phytoplasma TaxID=35773 RepID=A0A975IM33_LOWBP|nr:CDP-alcohol phosphatidyltransferase family protein [Candidatus Phytoplasma luffae]QTX03097.1 CDP-diacylglycerol-serine O-phosphatidyltransferase [Candidatus Phytoplasma luffae]
MFLGIYNYTVYLTYLNLFMGTLGIFLIEENFNLKWPFICLFLAGVCDMFDGAVSNLKKNKNIKEKRYGVQIDSLADIISFGVLPILIGNKLFEECFKDCYSSILHFLLRIFVFTVFGLYILAVLIRLAYFNVLSEEYLNLDPCQEKNNNKIYIGLPVTVVSFIFPILYLIEFLIKENFANLSLVSVFFKFVYVFFILGLSFLFVCDKIKFKKPKFLFF